MGSAPLRNRINHVGESYTLTEPIVGKPDGAGAGEGGVGAFLPYRLRWAFICSDCETSRCAQSISRATRRARVLRLRGRPILIVAASCVLSRVAMGFRDVRNRLCGFFRQTCSSQTSSIATSYNGCETAIVIILSRGAFEFPIRLIRPPLAARYESPNLANSP